MLVQLKMELLARGIRQVRMAVELGMDPAKFSRIINEIAAPTPEERRAIAEYLVVQEALIFPPDNAKASGGEGTLVRAS